MNSDPLDLLLRMYREGVAVANPAACLEHHWPKPARGRTGIIACGKAAVQMAAQAVRHYGNGLEGVVIHPDYEQILPLPLGNLTWYAASHPVPGEYSVKAAQAALEFAAGMGPEDLLLVLLSGGGSSLMSLPAEGITLAEKQDLGRRLLASGAGIKEINCVRKHVSRIKGGRLAAACKAPMVTLAISDVPGNDPSVIASGPTIEDRSTLARAREVLLRYGIKPAPSVTKALADPLSESPRFGQGCPAREFKIVAGGYTALEAAAVLCQRAGFEPILLGDWLEGEARELGKAHAKQALDQSLRKQRCCILSGGETTVSICGNPGSGGRNTEYALSLAIALGGREGIWSISADTDGIDGTGQHAGAMTDPGTLERAHNLGIDPETSLLKNDSATFFEHAGGLLIEGPTGTNINDFRAILINP